MEISHTTSLWTSALFMLIGTAPFVSNRILRFKNKPKMLHFTGFQKNVYVYPEAPFHKNLERRVYHVNLARLKEHGYKVDGEYAMPFDKTVSVENVKSVERFLEDCKTCDVHTLLTEETVFGHKIHRLEWHAMK